MTILLHFLVFNVMNFSKEKIPCIDIVLFQVSLLHSYSLNNFFGNLQEKNTKSLFYYSLLLLNKEARTEVNSSKNRNTQMDGFERLQD